MLSRRRFALLSAAALTGAVPSLPAFAERSGGEVFSSGTLGAYEQGLMTQANMAGLVGTLFMVFMENNRTAYLRLREVTGTAVDGAGAATPAGTKGKVSSRLVAAGGVRPRQAVAVETVVQSVKFGRPLAGPLHMESFTAIFTTDGSVIPADTYVVDHGRLGRVALFLAPGKDAAGRNTAEATFASLVRG